MKDFCACTNPRIRSRELLFKTLIRFYLCSCQPGERLRPGSLLLALVEGQQGHVGHLDHLEAHCEGNQSDFHTSSQGFRVLGNYLDEVQAAIVGDKSCDFFAVLNELDPDTFPDGRVGLLGLDPPDHPHFLQDDALGVGSAPEGVGLQRRAQVRLLVLLVVPLLVPAVAAQ
uniref:Uncharacterized protein n=1 Tax=Zonotrichia albicollis TaxID=44394 RepID=A0A8D2MX96_ZONAL